MSVRLSHDVFCDRCGGWLHAFVSGVPKLKWARKTAQAGGWLYIRTPEGYKDLCPDCATAWKEEKQT